MKIEQQQITEFMTMAGQNTPPKPCVPSKAVRELRAKLIGEELLELCEALGVEACFHYKKGGKPVIRAKASKKHATDIVKAYDAIIDLLVVVIGSGVALGLDLEPGWTEVHLSNMRKFIGGHRRKDGKWMKPKNWQPPNLKDIVDQQLEIS